MVQFGMQWYWKFQDFNFLDQKPEIENVCFENPMLDKKPSCTTLVNSTKLTFDAICSQQYYPYPRYCLVRIN